MAQRNGGVLDLRHARHPQQPERRRQAAQVQVCGPTVGMSRKLAKDVSKLIQLLTTLQIT